MEKKNNKKNIVFSRFKSDFSYTLSFSGVITFILVFLYGFLALSLFGLFSTSYGSYFSLVLIILFLFLAMGLLTPFMYSYFANTACLSTKDRNKVSVRSLIKTSSFGFHRPYRGLLRNFQNLLLSIIIFMFSYFIVLILAITISYQIDGGIKAVIEEINNSPNFSTSDLLVYLSEKEGAFTYVFGISLYISLFIAVFFFLLRYSVNIFKYSFVPNIIGQTKQIINIVFRRIIKENRKQFYSGFAKYFAIIILSFFVGYSLSFLLLLFLINASNINISLFLMMISLTSVIIGLVCSLNFYPLLFNYYITIYPLYSIYFIKGFINISKEELEALKKSNIYGEEEKNKYIKEIERIIKQYEDIENDKDSEDKK